MKGKRVLFVPQKHKMSPEYEAQVKHFFEVTQKKLIAKYGANINMREKISQPIPALIIPKKSNKQAKPKLPKIKQPDRLYTQMQKDVMSIA